MNKKIILLHSNALKQIVDFFLLKVNYIFYI